MSMFVTAQGASVGPVGQGTWHLGEDASAFRAECNALRAGIEAGMNLIDTAEMYGEGAAEVLVGQAIQDFCREGIYLVSKVYPFHADRKDIFTSCENSLRRMKTDYLDLYLLHWRGSVPLAETVACMEELKAQGKIRAWGVSNFDTADMKELLTLPDGNHCAANQVLYHLGSRGIEYNLLPLLKRHNIPVMAYCPLAQGGKLHGGLLKNPAVLQIAHHHGITPTQVLLAFLLSHTGVLPIPCSGKVHHTQMNAKAVSVRLSQSELQLLDRAYPAPHYKMALDIV